MRMRARVIAPMIAVAVFTAACGAGSAADEAAPTAEPAVASTTMAAVVEEVVAGPLLVADTTYARDRCLTAIPAFERRVEVEGWPYEDDEEELSDEELERTLVPPIAFTDGVAAAGERPTIEPMGAFDVETVDLIQLDLFVETCFENGLVTEDE